MSDLVNDEDVSVEELAGLYLGLDQDGEKDTGSSTSDTQNKIVDAIKNKMDSSSTKQQTRKRYWCYRKCRKCRRWKARGSRKQATY